MATATATHSTTSPARARSASNAPLLTPPPPAANYGSTPRAAPAPMPVAALDPTSSHRKSTSLDWARNWNRTFISLVCESLFAYGFFLLARLVLVGGEYMHKDLQWDSMFKAFAETLAYWFAEPLTSTPCTDCGVVQAGLLRLLYIAFMWLVGMLVFIFIVFVVAMLGMGYLVWAATIVVLVSPPFMLLCCYLIPAFDGTVSILLSPSTSSRAAIATLLATPLVPLLTHILLVLLDFRLSTTSWTLIYVDSTVYYLVRWAEWQKRWIRRRDEEEELHKDAEEDADKP